MHVDETLQTRGDAQQVGSEIDGEREPAELASRTQVRLFAAQEMAVQLPGARRAPYDRCAGGRRKLKEVTEAMRGTQLRQQFLLDLGAKPRERS